MEVKVIQVIEVSTTKEGSFYIGETEYGVKKNKTVLSFKWKVYC